MAFSPSFMGGFSYTKNTQEAKVGPVELNVKEKKHVNVPMWAGVVAVVAGGGAAFPARTPHLSAVR